MPLPDNLRRMRTNRGITQESLAVTAGSTRATIGLLEIGKRSPSMKLLRRLAVALETTAAKLLE